MSSSENNSTRATLRTLLRSSVPSKIQTCLLDSLEKSTAAEQEALLALLSPLTAQAGISKHCVRCHETYRENQNHPKACKIEHDENGDGERTETGDDAITITLSCCGVEFDSEDTPPTEYCILAPHTTNLKDVVYYDERDDYEGREGMNENVVTCKTRGCSKKRKAAKNGDSVGKKRKST